MWVYVWASAPDADGSNEKTPFPCDAMSLRRRVNSFKKDRIHSEEKKESEENNIDYKEVK